MKVDEIISEQQLLEKGILGTVLGKLLGKGSSKGVGKAAQRLAARNAGKGSVAKGVGKVAATGATKASGLTYKKFTSAFGGFSGLLIKLITADALYEFYQEYKSAATQKEQYDAGDKTTELFGNVSPAEAQQKYDNQLNAIVGKAVLIAAPQLRIPGIAGKFAKWIVEGGLAVAGGAYGMMFGGPGGAAAGAAAGAGLGYASLGIIGNIGKILSKGITGVAFVAFVNSDFGQKFFSDMLHGELLTAIGGNARKFYEAADRTLIQSFSKGFKSGMSGEQPAATDASGQGKQPAAAAPEPVVSPNLTPQQASVEKEFNSWPLKITFKDKQAFVNGIPVTDENGYRNIDYYNLRNFQTTAKNMGKEFPMQIIPQDPSKPSYD